MMKVLPVYIMNFLLAIATTIGMTLIPILATDKLGLSLLMLGLIEGSTELISNILRLVTGNLFDRWQNRRLLFLFPTSLAFVAKTVLFFPSAITILITKIIERASNGAFAAPRDAYVGEHAQHKGSALGWLSVAKAAGCVLGPLLISLTTIYIGALLDNLFLCLTLACSACAGSIFCALMVETKELKQNIQKSFSYKDMSQIFRTLSPIFILTILFFLARFNDGLVMLFLKDQGFSEKYYTATIAIFNSVMLIVSPIFGYYIDQKKDFIMLIFTVLALLLFNAAFYNIHHAPYTLFFVGLAMWGIQRAGAQIIFTSMIFNKIPKIYYGTAIGVYSIISGIGIAIASPISGHLAGSLNYGYGYIFMYSGTLGIISIIFILLFKKMKLI